MGPGQNVGVRVTVTPLDVGVDVPSDGHPVATGTAYAEPAGLGGTSTSAGRIGVTVTVNGPSKEIGWVGSKPTGSQSFIARTIHDEKVSIGYEYEAAPGTRRTAVVAAGAVRGHLNGTPR